MKELTKEKTMTTKEIAEQLGTSKKVILENAKKCLPNKIIENGKQTFWTEKEVTILFERLRHNQSNQHREKGTVTGAVTVAETSMTNALRLDLLHKEIEKILQDENEKLKQENQKLEAEKENLKIELDESKEWYSIKRMQKLNPNICFKYSVLKAESKRLGYEIKKVFDQNYGEVNAYHKDVYENLYFDTVDFE